MLQYVPNQIIKEDSLKFSCKRIRLNGNKCRFKLGIENKTEASLVYRWFMFQTASGDGDTFIPVDGHGKIEPGHKGRYKVTDSNGGGGIIPGDYDSGIEVSWSGHILDYRQNALCLEVFFYRGTTEKAPKTLFEESLDECHATQSSDTAEKIEYFCLRIPIIYTPVSSPGLVVVLKPDSSHDEEIKNLVGKETPQPEQWYPFQVPIRPIEPEEHRYGLWAVGRDARLTNSSRANLVVWSAELKYDGGFERHPVVVKQIHDRPEFHQTDTRQSRTMFQRFDHELTITSKFTHENIVKLLGFSVHPYPCLVLPYYRHGNITEFISNLIDHCPENPLKEAPLWLRLGLIKDLGRALQHLHDKHVVHADLKPDNIMIDRDRRTKRFRAFVIDFGISAYIEQFEAESNNRDVLGVLAYIAPEVVQKFGPEGAKTLKSDMFALGCIATEVAWGPKQVNLVKIRLLNPEGNKLAFKLLPDVNYEQWLPCPVGFEGPAGHVLHNPVPRESGFWEIIRSCLSFGPENRPEAVNFLESISKMELLESCWGEPASQEA